MVTEKFLGRENAEQSPIYYVRFYLAEKLPTNDKRRDSLIRPGNLPFSTHHIFFRRRSQRRELARYTPKRFLFSHACSIARAISCDLGWRYLPCLPM
jgi:hypothetical protein